MSRLIHRIASDTVIDEAYKWLCKRRVMGFDFLGYHFSPEGLTVAMGTLRRFVERIVRLYEQDADYLCIGLQCNQLQLSII